MTTQKSAIAYLRATAQRRANESKVQLDSEEQVLAFLDTVRGFNQDKKCGGSYIPDDHTCHADKPATNAMQKAFKQRTKAAKLKQGSSSFNGIDKDSLLKVATGAAGIAAVAGAAGLARGYYSNRDSPSKQIGQQNQIPEINLTGQLANAEFEKEENQISSSENLTPALPKVTNNTEAPKTFVEVANPAYKELAEEINSEIDKVSTRVQKSISEGKTFGNPRDAYGARFELLQEEIEDIEDPEEREKLREGLRQKKETIDSLILSANRFTPERLSRYDLNLEPHTGNTSNLQNGLKDWSQFSKANFTQADGADALLNDQQYIQNKIEENQASYSPKNVLSVSKEGKVQAIALIKDEADGVAIDWLTSAPWNVVQGHPESVKGAGTAIMEQAFRLSQERGFGGKVYINGFSGTSGGFYRSFGAVIGTKGTEIPPEKAQQFLNSIDEARRIQRNRSDADEFERSVNFVLCVLASEELYSEAVLPAKIKHVKKIDAAEKMPDFAAQPKNNTRYDKKCGASYIPNHYTCHVGETAASAMQKTFKQRTGRPRLKQAADDVNLLDETDKEALKRLAVGVGTAAIAGAGVGFAVGLARGYYSTEEGAKERINEYKQKADEAAVTARKEIEAEYQRQLEETEARLTKEADDRVSEAVSDLESQYQSSTASVTGELNSRIEELEANKQVELANLEAEKEEAVKKVAEEVAGQEQAKAEKAIQAERDRFATEQAKVQKQYAEQVAKLEAEKNSAIAKAEAESSTRSTLQAERDAMQREFTKQVTELEKAKNEAIEQATKEAHESAQKRILEERQRYADERAQLVGDYENKLEKATTPKPRNNKPGGMVSESGKGINLSASIIQGKVIATEDNPKVGTSKSALEKQVLDNVRNLKNEEYQRIQRDLAEEFREQTKKIQEGKYGSTDARWRAIENALMQQNRREALLDEMLGNGGSEWEKARTDHARFVQDLDISSPEALKDAARRFDRKAQQSFRDMIKAVERELSEAKQNEMKFDSLAIPLGASGAFKAGLERAFKRDAGSCPQGKHWVKDPRVKKGGGYCRTGGGKPNLKQNAPGGSNVGRNVAIAGVAALAATGFAGAAAPAALYLGIKRGQETGEFDPVTASVMKGVDVAFVNALNARPDELIEKSDRIPDDLKQKARDLTGATKRHLAGAMLKLEGAEVVDIDDKNNVASYKRRDGSVMSVGSVGPHAVMFGTQKGPDIEGLPSYDMEFHVNGSFGRKGMSSSDAKQVIRIAKSSFQTHLAQLPDDALIRAKPFSADGAGDKRKNIYTKNGFRDLGTGDGYIWSTKQNGQYAPIPDDYVDFMRDLVSKRRTDSINTDLTRWFQQRALRRDKGGGCSGDQHWVSDPRVKKAAAIADGTPVVIASHFRG